MTAKLRVTTDVRVAAYSVSVADWTQAGTPTGRTLGSKTSGLMAEDFGAISGCSTEEKKGRSDEGTLEDPMVQEGKLAIAHGKVLEFVDDMKMGPPQVRLLPISGSVFHGVFEEKEDLNLVEMLLRAVASAEIRLAPDFERRVQERAYFQYINNRCEDKQANFFEALRTELKKHIMNSCIEMCLLQPLEYDRHASVLEEALEASTAEASVAETCAISDIDVTAAPAFEATSTPESFVTMATPTLMLEDVDVSRVQVEVKSYGILGLSSKGKEVEPPDENTVLVDPAGLTFIQENGPAGAKGAAGANYKWLEINEDESFPKDVKEAITEECQAKYHAYAGGKKKCIHVVGPDFRTYDDTFTVDNAVDKLTVAYRNVLEQFCNATQEQYLQRMRLLPISGGIFSGRFKQNLPEMTGRAVQDAYQQLSENQKKHIKNSIIEMCIFMESEFEEFESAFQVQEAFAEDSMVQSDTSPTRQVPCRVTEAGIVLVAFGRHVSALVLVYWLLLRWL